MIKEYHLRIGCLLVTAVLSALIATAVLPYAIGWFAVATSVIALASIFLRFGWVVLFTILGAYAGLIFGRPTIGHGLESEEWGFLASVVLCTIVGFMVGAFLDAFLTGDRTSNSENNLHSTQ